MIPKLKQVKNQGKNKVHSERSPILLPYLSLGPALTSHFYKLLVDISFFLFKMLCEQPPCNILHFCQGIFWIDQKWDLLGQWVNEHNFSLLKSIFKFLFLNTVSAKKKFRTALIHSISTKKKGEKFISVFCLYMPNYLCLDTRNH